MDGTPVLAIVFVVVFFFVIVRQAAEFFCGIFGCSDDSDNHEDEDGDNDRWF